MNSVFLPPGSNPFQLPPLPQSYYFPSPSKEIQEKNVTLTPQKPHRRHEYSLPPEVYTPEQYSIYEDSPASAKPPLIPSTEQEDVVCDLQKYLINDVESWTSAQFDEKWSSKDSKVADNLFLDLTNQTPAMPSKSSSSGGPLTSTARSSKVTKKTDASKPLRVKTSFASDRNLSVDSERSSNIAMRLNRFRYGDPKPPEVRKKERMPLPSSTSTTKTRTQQLQSLGTTKIRPQQSSTHRPQSSGTTKTRPQQSTAQLPRPQSASMLLDDLTASRSQKSLSSSEKFDKLLSRNESLTKSKMSTTETKSKLSLTPNKSPEFPNTSLTTLNSRLEKLLHESTSVISSPEPQSSNRTSTDRSSSSFDMKVSSFDSTTSDEIKSLPHKMQWQKENIQTSKIHFSPSKQRQNEDDILYQWRLKRKLQKARNDVAKNNESSYQLPASRQPLYRNEAEKPFTAEASHVLQDQQSPSICGNYRSQQMSGRVGYHYNQGWGCQMRQSYCRGSGGNQNAPPQAPQYPSTQAQQYPPHIAQYPPHDTQYPLFNTQYPPSNTQYPPHDGQCPPPHTQYPPPDAQYPPPEAQYPPPDAQYPPPDGQYPPHNAQYPPSNTRQYATPFNPEPQNALTPANYNHKSTPSNNVHPNIPNPDSLPRNPPNPGTRSVGIAPMISSETQTGRSLIFSDDGITERKETVKRSSSMSSFPHTSTPSSSVSFHRVKIVQAELENSPQTSKGSPQARIASPLSCRTEATTTWSSTDQQPCVDHIKRNDYDERSPVSSVKTSDQRFASDSESCSPTANVVRQVIGSRLFNTTQTPLSTSRVARLKDKKKQISAELNGSYTTSGGSEKSLKSTTFESDQSGPPLDQPVPLNNQPGPLSIQPGPLFNQSVTQTDQPKPPSNQPGLLSNHSVLSSHQTGPPPDQPGHLSDNDDASFNPEEMFDQLLADIANDPGDYSDDPVLTSLRNQRDKFLEEFRVLEEEIDKSPTED